MQHGPDFTKPLFYGLWLAYVIPVCIGTLGLWMWYTPVWGELGVQVSHLLIYQAPACSTDLSSAGMF